MWREEAREGSWEARGGGRGELVSSSALLWWHVLQLNLQGERETARDVEEERIEIQPLLATLAVTWGLSHHRKLSPQASNEKKDIKKRHNNIPSPPFFSQNNFRYIWLWTTTTTDFHRHAWLRKSNMCTPHVHMHADSYMWSHSTLQFFLGVHFTRHLYSLPGCLEWCCVWRPAMPQRCMVSDGLVWLAVVTPVESAWPPHDESHPCFVQNYTHTNTGWPTSSRHSSEQSKQEKQLSSSLVVHGD